MRYLVLIASIIIQICLGGLYAWTTFVPYLKDNYGLSGAQVQVIFGCLIAMFTVTMFFTGRMLDRLGPKPLAAIGGLLFAAGYLVASYSGGSFIILLLGITVLTGLGTGFGYVVPLAICARWFPRDKGLVTGLAVAGFGGGAVLLTAISKPLLHEGMDVLLIFRWIALFYGLAIVLSSLMLKAPAPLHGSRARLPISFRALLKDPVFHALMVGMFCGTFGGLLVVGTLGPMALENGLTPGMVAVAISMFAVGNAAGRVLWGLAADRVPRTLMLHSLAFLALSLLLMLPALGSQMFFVIVAGLIGFGFGGCFVIYAADTASRYGIERVANIYPIIFMAYGASGSVGPLIGGALHDVVGSYVPGLIISAAVVVTGMIVCLTLLRAGRRSRSILTVAEPQRTKS